MSELRETYSKILMVSGSRSISDPLYVKHRLDDVRNEYEFDCLIHGDAAGVDKAVQFYAEFNKIPVRAFLPNWKRYGKPAGIFRNIEMAKICHKGITIWDGKSPGTKHARRELTRRGKLLKAFYYNGDESKCPDCGGKIKDYKMIHKQKGKIASIDYKYLCCKCYREC